VPYAAQSSTGQRTGTIGDHFSSRALFLFDWRHRFHEELLLSELVEAWSANRHPIRKRQSVLNLALHVVGTHSGFLRWRDERLISGHDAILACSARRKKGRRARGIFRPDPPSVTLAHGANWNRDGDRAELCHNAQQTEVLEAGLRILFHLKFLSTFIHREGDPDRLASAPRTPAIDGRWQHFAGQSANTLIWGSRENNRGRLPQRIRPVFAAVATWLLVKINWVNRKNSVQNAIQFPRVSTVTTPHRSAGHWICSFSAGVGEPNCS